MRTLVIPCLLIAISTTACTGPDGGLDLCAQCLSSDGVCAEGCCALEADPVVLCQAYLSALCDRGQACAPEGATEFLFCDLDCGAMNACELIALVAFPDDLQSCRASIATAPCDPDEDGVWIGATPACQQWKSRTTAAIEDSTCHQESGGESRIEPAGPGA